MDVSLNEFYSMASSYDGYCSDCDDVTRCGGTEPDIVPEHTGYECPDCGGENIYGVEMAMVCELILVEV